MLVALVLILLAILGAPLFAVIATSAMLGFHGEETDLMTMAIEIQSIADLPFLSARARRRSAWCGLREP